MVVNKNQSITTGFSAKPKGKLDNAAGTCRVFVINWVLFLMGCSLFVDLSEKPTCISERCTLVPLDTVYNEFDFLHLLKLSAHVLEYPEIPICHSPNVQIK